MGAIFVHVIQMMKWITRRKIMKFFIFTYKKQSLNGPLARKKHIGNNLFYWESLTMQREYQTPRKVENRTTSRESSNYSYRKTCLCIILNKYSLENIKLTRISTQNSHQIDILFAKFWLINKVLYWKKTILVYFLHLNL